MSEEKLYPKEKALIDLVAAERLEGRRVLVYVTHTGTRDITGRMDDILTRHGFRVAVMKADAVAPNRREAWVADRGEGGHRRPHLPPQAGADRTRPDRLPNYLSGTKRTIACTWSGRRRGARWRIGQTRPVKVVFMSYRNTLQADALKLVAKKMQSSLAVEGELPEDGLAAYGDDGDDMMMALARRIVSGEEEDEAETMEEVFAQARNAEATAEELLVDDGWKVLEIEPEAVAVNGNGNGHHANRHWARRSSWSDGQRSLSQSTATITQPSLSTGTATRPPRSTVTATATTTRPRSRSSRCSPWAEFMAEEPGKPKRKSKPQPATLSMFEWAMTLEQQREEEPVGAGR